MCGFEQGDVYVGVMGSRRTNGVGSRVRLGAVSGPRRSSECINRRCNGTMFHCAKIFGSHIRPSEGAEQFDKTPG